MAASYQHPAKLGAETPPQYNRRQKAHAAGPPRYLVLRIFRDVLWQRTVIPQTIGLVLCGAGHISDCLRPLTCTCILDCLWIVSGCVTTLQLCANRTRRGQAERSCRHGTGDARGSSRGIAFSARRRQGVRVCALWSRRAQLCRTGGAAGGEGSGSQRGPLRRSGPIAWRLARRGRHGVGRRGHTGARWQACC